MSGENYDHQSRRWRCHKHMPRCTRSLHECSWESASASSQGQCLTGAVSRAGRFKALKYRPAYASCTHSLSIKGNGLLDFQPSCHWKGQIQSVFFPHFKQTHKSISCWLCHCLVTSKARPFVQSLFCACHQAFSGKHQHGCRAILFVTKPLSKKSGLLPFKSDENTYFQHIQGWRCPQAAVFQKKISRMLRWSAALSACLLTVTLT